MIATIHYFQWTKLVDRIGIDYFEISNELTTTYKDIQKNHTKRYQNLIINDIKTWLETNINKLKHLPLLLARIDNSKGKYA